MIGILGGSFDPVHNGHLYIANKCLQELSLEEIIFLPCGIHPLGKTFIATPLQRITLLQRALAGQARFSIDTREINSVEINYTIDTLQMLTQDYPDKKFAFIMGMDQFLNLPQWHRWQEFLLLTSLIVLARPGYALAPEHSMYAYWQQHRCEDVKQFTQSEQHHIYLLTLEPLDISSSTIRSQWAKGIIPDRLVPKAIIDYLQHEKIYE